MATPEQATASMIANMPEKTGKSLDAWLKIVAKAKLEKHGEIVSMLKADHGMTHGFANLVAIAARGGLEQKPATDDPAAGQYEGAKAALKPIFDKLIETIMKYGNDIELAPKKGYVSLRRSKQFATIHPSTATRVDLGIKLSGVAPKGRLEAAGSWNAMVTHRVRLEKVGDVDAEVKAWLKQAYEAA